MLSIDRRTLLAGLALSPPLLASCGTLDAQNDDGVSQSLFGTTPDGEPVSLFVLTNRSGARASIMTWGAALTSFIVPDRDGRPGEVVLGLDTLEDYLARSRNFGTTVGRYAGRIADGRFTLDGKMVQLETGGSRHSSHGGPVGFAKRNWTATSTVTGQGPGVSLSLVSADGDQGFPGELRITLVYRLTHDNRLMLDFTATTSRPTVLNPTHHSYFNLSGDPERLILDHELLVDADRFTPFDDDKLVTGELRSVAGTPFDFRTANRIGAAIDADDAQIRIGGGYDHNFVVRGEPGVMRRAATAWDSFSGRTLQLWTTEPGVQLYTANSVEMIGRGGAHYAPHCGFCLEPQHFQNSPNRPEFPSTVLRPGETWRSHSEYRLGIFV